MFLLLGLVACAEGPFDAPYTATLSSPVSALTLTYTGGINQEDGFGMVFFDQVTVSNEDRYGRNLPLENVVVDISSGWGGTYILPERAVKSVDDFREDCAAGQGDEEFQDLCDALLNDPDNDYYELSAEYAIADEDADGNAGFRPNYMRGITNNQGVVEFYLFVDSTPGAGTEFGISMSIPSDYTSMIVSTVTQAEK
jgi:hypothetical protein